MNERKIPIDLECGINIYTLIAGGKWKPCIIHSIHKGINRPNQIHKAISQASPRVLNMQIKELLESNIVSKKVHPGLPLKVEYSLTEVGKSLLPIIDLMDQWGTQNRETINAYILA
ncbi:helix-turn-helix transcriptional regulator [Fulvivirga ulvae]|uniref:winged helix-turn-helix transcriptional regulator n=1 Tax=Fulvivirga ulvae TaxID=2904245 RepID=UPI001F3EFAFF|nr:helix-turn-helix domain-containing protein [Fulvivirga ulvae]UII29889.1 helix-turn-helix transcriptional regulator [Fulvivirga ulvae]